MSWLLIIYRQMCPASKEIACPNRAYLVCYHQSKANTAMNEIAARRVASFAVAHDVFTLLCTVNIHNFSFIHYSVDALREMRKMSSLLCYGVRGRKQEVSEGFGPQQGNTSHSEGAPSTQEDL